MLQHLERLRTELLATAAPGALRRLLAEWLPDHLALRPARGLYIWGGVGRGKSYLMDLFFANLPIEAKQRRHFYRFMRDVHAQLRTVQHRERPLDALAARLAAKTRVICFDELFVADIGDAMLLHGLFAGLFSRGVSFVITSNQAPAQLYRDGLQRERFLPAIALLERELEVLQLEGGADYRLRHLEQAAIYLSSAAADSEARLAQIFSSLASQASDGSGAAQTPGVLQIEGRPIATRRGDQGVAWFDFTALCEGPRSAADYVEIARLLHSVIVSDVPVFEQRDDAARRFIALVDALYDHDVKLVVSAAAAPFELYRGERLHGDFARTASRLIEMQSREYLAREHRP